MSAPKKPEQIWARCDNCGVKIVGHLAVDYQDLEAFCSLTCNQTYRGDHGESIDDEDDGEYF